MFLDFSSHMLSLHTGEGEAAALWNSEGLQPSHGQNNWQLQGSTCALILILHVDCAIMRLQLS